MEKPALLRTHVPLAIAVINLMATMQFFSAELYISILSCCVYVFLHVLYGAIEILFTCPKTLLFTETDEKYFGNTLWENEKAGDIWSEYDLKKVSMEGAQSNENCNDSKENETYTYIGDR